MAEHLCLKWGSLKSWNLESEEALWALRRYLEEGVTVSAAMQCDTPRQKRAICDLIDAIDGEIINDWSGESMTKDEAKRYVMEYDGGG